MDLVSLSQAKIDLINCKTSCDIHANGKGFEWASSLLSSVLNENSTLSENKQAIVYSKLRDRHYFRAKNFIKLGQYKRAALYLEQHHARPANNYLYFYTRYMAIENERLDSMAESDCETSAVIASSLQQYRQLLADIDSNNTSWICYITGCVHLKLNNIDKARDSFIESINLDPLTWPSWKELTNLVNDKHHLKLLNLPSHWFRLFFYGAVYNKLQMYEEAYDLYSNILGQYFPNSVYLLCEIAKAQNELRDVEAANETFEKARNLDIYRNVDMDVCSNALYVSGKMNKLASLAHRANEIEPYRVETCFCLANFYSLRGQHNKAAEFFSRALKLDPSNISAYILMGHEFMEMKSTEEAIKAYRSAINLDRTDHRAWYGLGQLYEILKLPNISLDHYLTAYKLRPNDSRIVTALKEIYEKLGWTNHAEVYHKRAQ